MPGRENENGDLIWVGREGKRLGTVAPVAYNTIRIRLSPDERRVAFTASVGKGNAEDIFIYDIERGPDQGSQPIRPAKETHGGRRMEKPSRTHRSAAAALRHIGNRFKATGPSGFCWISTSGYPCRVGHSMADRSLCVAKGMSGCSRCKVVLQHPAK
jgi:hypothetical protein